MARYSYTRETYVDPYPGHEDSEVFATSSCIRCGGAQFYTVYAHVDGGTCFRCNGDSTWQEVTTYGDMRRMAKAEVKSINAGRLAYAKAVAKFAAGIAEAAATRPEWGTLVRGEGVLDSEDGNEFVTKLARLLEDGKSLTEKQLQAGADAIDRWNRKDEIAAEKEAKHAATPALVEGRYTLTATVKSHKLQEGNYGETWKMLLEDTEGRRYWGTIPQSIWDAMEAAGMGYNLDKLTGCTVTMTATVTVSSSDHAFGFYSRPTKATIVS